ncbi:MAG: 2-C-methyl-D-erythritol 2,4-cyclodiphosphate synthase [Victivallales bacterium]|nr:2-C-methyl-D-erythritol 2,4-cyclodiphosphate synthase [Victivallales bacterium]
MFRIGHGHDAHRLAEGRRLVLGGVDIPFKKGLLGHSDADVLAHAVTDAVLGALAEGDIGRWFPDNDPRYKDADSISLLRQVVTSEKFEEWKVVNLDCTIVCQKPRLADFIPEMRRNLAEALDSDISCISVKATTTEGMGPCGRGEGIECSAVVLLCQS